MDGETMRVSYQPNGFSLRVRGFSLIEIMVALVIGAILLLGIASIFTNASSNIRLQRGIASIQENGRIAMSRLSADLSQAGTLYCNSLDYTSPFRGEASSASGITPPKAIKVVADFDTDRAAGGLFFGLPSRSFVPSGYVSARFMLMGHECTASGCSPALDEEGAVFPTLPAIGSGVGQRVANADIVTVRRISGFGAPIIGFPNSASGYWEFPGDQMARLSAKVGDQGLAMIGTCNSAAIFHVEFTSNSRAKLTDQNESFSFLQDGGKNGQFSDPRFFWLPSNLLTVTYFVQNVADPTTGGVVPALMRQENGAAPAEIARGVARFDLRYAVTNVDDQTRWLTADEVQNIPAPDEPAPDEPLIFRTYQCGPRAFYVDIDEEPGCAWRDVTAIEFGMLIRTTDSVGANLQDTAFSYSMNDEHNVSAPVNAALFREFRSVVPIESRGK
jgi:type IV pilus assembly protein PilW